MDNKKLTIIAILFIALSAVGVLYSFSKKQAPVAVEKQSAPADEAGREPVSTSTRIERFKEAHPEYSASQVDFFAEAADQGSIEACESRADREDCVSAVAFISQKYYFCGDIEGAKKIDCSNAVLAGKADLDIGQCDSIRSDDLKSQCLRDIFSSYEKIEDCSGLSGEAKGLCEGAIYYRTALFDGNKKLCAQIGNGFLRSYCEKYVIDGSEDSDGDGISDIDEIKKYQTDPKNPDTDGDGHSDREEIANGYDPKSR